MTRAPCYERRANAIWAMPAVARVVSTVDDCRVNNQRNTTRNDRLGRIRASSGQPADSELSVAHPPWMHHARARGSTLADPPVPQLFIKDVKSSNGTFINGERPRPEGAESEPFELKSWCEFGIDIVGEDNKTIIHHKIAARVAQAGPTAYGVGALPAAGKFSFAPVQLPNAPGQQRRPSFQQGLIGLGDRGRNMNVPGKSGLTLDHILSRLQGELQKSRNTGAELHSLTSAMNEIHDTLGGNLLPNLPPHPSNLPPVMPPQSQQQQEESEQQQAPQAPSPSDSDKIRSLETMLAEHEAIKREVGSLRELMEECKREMDTSRGRSGSPSGRRQYGHDDDSHYMSDDDDNVHSVSTIVPHELDRVDEEDEEQLATEEKRSSGGGGGKSWVARACQSQRERVQVQTEATEQLAEAMCSEQPPDSAAQEAEQRTRESLTEMVNEWKKNEEWTEEREDLRRAKDEWETRIRVVEDGVGSNISKVESMLGTLAALPAQQHSFLNGNGKLTHSGGLVTPPSPRSLSAESTRPRQRRKRSSSSRGRSRSRSASMAAGVECLPWTADDSSISDTESHAASDRATAAGEDEPTRSLKGMPFPITPELSVLNHPLSSPDDASGTATDSQTRSPPKDLSHFNLSAAVGLLILSVVTGAVLWRIKPEGSVSV
ncbi:hypothetical protein POSPLADRAFT_1160987 [Postia placenta MAD-698-R-SB12]|uniref:FHA domain-containing protein n=1 Tax=Postia placenta MAD-698-R-SB12 TaxID=670580 RepID=A0A1X6MI67_9APHY|nr:hypothetical protein POSPLADRAFT_1160987 [Postia placenta MAD-698-R-SB12]OSX56111.1 hypothetical protein POSPLADRAFT_1160987 [Postia placenta MAD-698-R-SB12]